MANSVFFEGFRAEHFSGWDNTGAAVYTGVAASDTAEPNSLGYVNLFGAQALPNTLRGCLWGEFLNIAQQPINLNDFWICLETRSNTFQWWNGTNPYDYTTNWNGDYGEMQNQAVWPFHLFILHTNGTGTLSLRPTPGTYGYSLYLQNDLVDLTTATILNIPTWTGAHDGGVHRHSIQVAGAGTANGSVSWYIDGNLYGSCSVDLTDYSDFHAISFHADSGRVYRNVNGGWADRTRLQTHVFYAFVSDFRTVHTYLDYRQMTDVSDSTWVGDTTQLSNYPVQFNVLGGLYSTAPQQSFTAKFSKDFTAQSIYYPKLLRTVLNTSSYLTDYGTVVQLSASDTSSNTVAYGRRNVSSDTNVSLWESSVNPFTQKDWVLADINSVAFSFSRTIGSTDGGRA